MKNGILRSVLLAALVACALSAGIAGADVTVQVDPTAITLGYMNVFDLPANGGAFLWGSGWGVADLTATWSNGFVTLGPNCIGDANPYWYTPSGGPGATGNKIMEANLYAQKDDGSLAGQKVTFVGCVSANTLASSHVAIAFIKDFAADWSSYNMASLTLPASGHFTLSLDTVNEATRHVQWGFQMKGPDVWVTDLAPYGSVTIGTEAATAAHKTSWGVLKSLYR